MPGANIQNTTSSSFKDFYLDEKLVGHSFLKPSIFVYETAQRIISPLESKGCDAFIEVITRIALAIILVIAAIVAVLFTPLGLICKGLASLCTPKVPKSPHVQPKPKPTSPVKPPVRPVVKPPVNPIAGQQPMSQDLKNTVAIATQVLDGIESDLNKVSFRKINITQVREAAKRLEVESVITVLSAVTEHMEPLGAFSERYNLLKARMASLEMYHKDYHHRFEEKKGEVAIKDDGDCLFVSFYEAMYQIKLKTFLADETKLLEQSTQAAESERKNIEAQLDVIGKAMQKLEKQKENSIQMRTEVVEWMTKNCAEDKELQKYLVNSFTEHTLEKIRKLETEIDNLKDMLSMSEIDIKSVGEQQQAAQEELDLLTNNTLPKIMESMGTANNSEIYFDQIADMVTESYFPEMAKQGVFGGAAELYALSEMHQLCIQVFQKTGNAIERKPAIINSKYENNGVCSLTHTHNHYNTYFPQATTI